MKQNKHKMQKKKKKNCEHKLSIYLASTVSNLLLNCFYP